MNNDKPADGQHRLKIFYSWQSDLPNSTNRGFIETALRAAAKSIHSDSSVKVEPVVERDTQGVSGAPDIAQTIFDKITASDIFVGDVSIISGPKPRSGKRPVPNPNVLIELGYAVGCHGWGRVILIANTGYGKLSLLPFDLQQRRCVAYSVHEAEEDKSVIRNRLKSILEGRIRECVGSIALSEQHGVNDADQAVLDAIAGLRAREVRDDSRIFSLADVFRTIGADLALGASEAQVADACRAKFGFPYEEPRWPYISSKDILGPLLYYEVVAAPELDEQDAMSSWSPRYSLTPLGMKVMRALDMPAKR